MVEWSSVIRSFSEKFGQLQSEGDLFSSKLLLQLGDQRFDGDGQIHEFIGEPEAIALQPCEIKEVLDTTDHAAGTNPYYRAQAR